MSVILRNILQKYPIRNIINVQVQQERNVKRWLKPTLQTISNLKKRGPEIPPDKRSTYIEWNYRAELFAFSHRLGEKFDNKLLEESFLDESYIIQQKVEQEKLGITDGSISSSNNESLAQEGLKFINKYTVGYLRHVMPKLPEEGIKAIQEYLVKDETLAHISKFIGTRDLILSADVYEPSVQVYAKCFCAIVGALYKSSGADKASLFVRDFVLTQLAEKDISDIWYPEKPWETLQEITQREGKSTAEARIAHEAGVGTLLQTFCIAIFNDKIMIGKGYGETLHIARDMAAIDSLRRMFGITDSMAPFPLLPKSGPTFTDIQNNLNVSNKSLSTWTNN